MRLRELFLASALAVALGAPALAQDQGPPVSAMYVFSGGADSDAVQQVVAAQKALNAYSNAFPGNPCKASVLQATFAGHEAGTYIEVVQCPNEETFLRGGRILAADPQYRKLLGDADSKARAADGKLLSQSLYEEVR